MNYTKADCGLGSVFQVGGGQIFPQSSEKETPLTIIFCLSKRGKCVYSLTARGLLVLSCLVYVSVSLRSVPVVYVL